MSAHPEPKALPAGERPTMGALAALFALQLEMERKWIEGPWSRWDGELLERWRTEAKDAVSACMTALGVELDRADGAVRILEVYEGEIRWLRAHADAALAGDQASKRLGEILHDRARYLQRELEEQRADWRVRLL